MNTPEMAWAGSRYLRGCLSPGLFVSMVERGGSICEGRRGGCLQLAVFLLFRSCMWFFKIMNDYWICLFCFRSCSGTRKFLVVSKYCKPVQEEDSGKVEKNYRTK